MEVRTIEDAAALQETINASGGVYVGDITWRLGGLSDHTEKVMEATFMGLRHLCGSLVIKESPARLTLYRVETISGDLIADEALDLESLHADSLRSIGGSLRLFCLPNVEIVSFEMLKRIGGTLFVRMCDKLAGLWGLSGVRSCFALHVEDMKLPGLYGLNLDAVTMVTLQNLPNAIYLGRSCEDAIKAARVIHVDRCPHLEVEGLGGEE